MKNLIKQIGFLCIGLLFGFAIGSKEATKNNKIKIQCISADFKCIKSADSLINAFADDSTKATGMYKDYINNKAIVDSLSLTQQ